MIWIVVGIIICFALIIRILRDNGYTVNARILLSIAIALCSFGCTVSVWLFSSLVVTSFAEIDYNDVVSDTKIVALKDNQGVGGNFYIMGGYVDGGLYYYYTTETELGYKTEKVKAENSYIKYTDGETHIERYIGEFANDKVKLLGSPVCEDRYVIYCPHGTITNEFAVDLE